MTPFPLPACNTNRLTNTSSSTRVRAHTLSIGRNVYYLCSVALGVINGYLINPTGGNWKGKSGFLWFGTTMLVLLWAVFRLPETKGRTYQELDILFAKGIPAWRFKGQSLDGVGEARDVVRDRKGGPD